MNIETVYLTDAEIEACMHKAQLSGPYKGLMFGYNIKGYKRCIVKCHPDSIFRGAFGL